MISWYKYHCFIIIAIVIAIIFITIIIIITVIIIIIIIITIIIISQTAIPLVKANSYKPEGTSREGSPVRKGKRQKIGDK